MSYRLMGRRHACSRIARSVALVEPLEDRRLFSAYFAPAYVPAVPSPHAASTVATSHVATIRPFDDDGGDGFGGDASGGDTGSSGDTGGGDATDGGGTTSDPVTDNGGEAGGSVASSGSSDAGEGAGSGSTTDPTTPNADGGTTTTTSPVDANPTTGSDATNNTGGDDAGTSDDNGTATGDDDAILYPTGDPYDDALYDDGGGTTLVIVTPAPRAANFGGTLRVRLPANPVIGDAGVATVTVFNTGGRATGQFDLAVGVTPDGSAASAIRVADETVPVRLGHDLVAVYNVPFTLPATLVPGTYQFLTLIDAGNAFAETDETDNVAIGPSVTIAAATRDVAVTSVSVRQTVRAGRPAAVAVHLREAGTVAESGPTTITVTAMPLGGSTGPIQLLSVARPVKVKPGKPTTVNLRVPLPALPAGRYRLTVTVTPVSPADADAADKSAVAATTVG